MTDYIKPVPESRTIINGMWSDLADVFHASFTDRFGLEHGLCVYVKQSTSDPISEPFASEPQTFTLASATTPDINTFSVEPDSGIVTGDIITLIDEPTGDQMTATALLNVADIVTVDSPIIRSFDPQNTTALRSSDSLLVDGSANNVIMSVKPIIGDQLNISSVTIEIESPTNFGFSSFGALAKLTNGIVLRVNKGDGSYTNLINVKSVLDLILNSSYNEFFKGPGVGGTKEAFVADINFGGLNSETLNVRLDSNKNESLELVIQDNISTGNTIVRAKAKGRKV